LGASTYLRGGGCELAVQREGVAENTGGGFGAIAGVVLGVDAVGVAFDGVVED
jgi:hypothetical protein